MSDKAGDPAAPTTATEGKKTTVSEFVLKALKKAKMCQPLTDDQKVALRNLGFAVDTDETVNGMRMTEAGDAAIERPRKVKEADAMAKKPKASKKLVLAQKDQEMSKKYKHFVAGSLRTAEGYTKLRCEINCTADGAKKSPKCKGERTVFSSDVFQVKVCEECRDYSVPKPKKEKKAKAKKALKAKVRVKKEKAAPTEPERTESAPETVPAVDPETAQ